MRIIKSIIVALILLVPIIIVPIIIFQPSPTGNYLTSNNPRVKGNAFISSSTVTGNPSENLDKTYDGIKNDCNNYWSGVIDAGPTTPWVKVDLGSVQTVSVDVWWGDSMNYIYTSNNDVDWGAGVMDHVVGEDISCPGGGENDIKHFQVTGGVIVTARYIMFGSVSPPCWGCVAKLFEFEISGFVPPTPTPTPTPPTPTPPTPTPPTPTPPTPTPPTPTPSGSSIPTPSYTYTPTPTPSYSLSPTPTLTGDVTAPVIIYIIDNINQKTYEVSKQTQDEAISICDREPTFIGTSIFLEESVDIFNNGDPDSKAAEAPITNGDKMWSASPENPLSLGDYSAYAGPFGPTNTVWFNVVECVNGSPIPTFTTSPSESPLLPGEEFFSTKNTSLPWEIAALLLLLFSSLAVLWPSMLNFIANSVPLAELINGSIVSAPIMGRGRASGIVYEAQTKKPIKKAVIRLFSADNHKLREVVITNDKGEFSLIVPQGSYYLKVSSTNYDFPSQKIRGKSDGRYDNLYFGEIIEVKGGADVSQSQALNLNIPLDKSAALNLEEKAIKILKIIEAVLIKIKWPCLALGLAAAVIAIYLKINILNIIIIGLYFIILLYELYRLLAKARPYGLVFDEGKKAVDLSLIRFRTKEGKINATAISGRDGKFTAQVNPQEYLVSAKKNGYLENKIKINLKSARRMEKLDLELKSK